MSRIERVRARQILDSRGHPTVEVDVVLNVGCTWPRLRARWAHRLGAMKRSSCGMEARRGPY